MKRLFLCTLAIVMLISIPFATAVIDVDTDDNSAVDVNKGGTNGTNASEARTNLGVPGINGTPALHLWAVWYDSATIKSVTVTGSKVVCSDSNGEPVACTNLTDIIPRNDVLTGLTPAAGAVASTDTILQAFGKLVYLLTLSDGQVFGRYSGTYGGIAIDADLSAVSSNDDTVPSAKATKAMGDLKALIGHTAQYSATPTISDPDTWTMSGDGMYGGTWIANAAGTGALPVAAAGMNIVVKVEGTGVARINPNGSEVLYLNGTACSAGYDIYSSGTTGDLAAIQYRASGSWSVDAKGWTCGS